MNAVEAIKMAVLMLDGEGRIWYSTVRRIDSALWVGGTLFLSQGGGNTLWHRGDIAILALCEKLFCSLASWQDPYPI